MFDFLFFLFLFVFSFFFVLFMGGAEVSIVFFGYRVSPPFSPSIPRVCMKDEAMFFLYFFFFGFHATGWPAEKERPVRQFLLFVCVCVPSHAKVWAQREDLVKVWGLKG